MSMVDSSVGGKTGVNHPSGKHERFIAACSIDTDTLPLCLTASSYQDLQKLEGGLIRDSFFNGKRRISRHARMKVRLFMPSRNR